MNNSPADRTHSLYALLHALPMVPHGVQPLADMQIHGLSEDSRTIKKGMLFLARCGRRSDGGEYISEAVGRGAVAVVAERLPAVLPSVPLWRSKELPQQIGIIASRFYGVPSEQLSVIGITGTNGKSSVAYLLTQALTYLTDQPSGYIGTLGYGLFPDLVPAGCTTPDPIHLQRLLCDLCDKGARHVAMEVSSQALAEYRVNGVNFNVAVMTNISRDHLDYHHDLARYTEAKMRLFHTHCPSKVVVNLDDASFGMLQKNLKKGQPVISYSLLPYQQKSRWPQISACVDQHGSDRHIRLQIDSDWGKAELCSKLHGEFSAYNLLAALAALCHLGFDVKDAVGALAECVAPLGRMQYFGGGRHPTVIVDYAHTPAALAAVLASIRSDCRGRLYCIFGCGGERDKGKRPEMGGIASRYADTVILTNDNPRFEDPLKIIDQIASGISAAQRSKSRIEVDRAAAIRYAMEHARSGDVVLIAGRGHESSQEIRGKHLPFSDQAVVGKLLMEQEA